MATALEDYLQSTPYCRHTVLAWRRPGAQTGDHLERLAAAVIPLPAGRLAQVRTVRRWVRQLRPDVVHAHSSYAGLYVRLFTAVPGSSLVYTPHAYAFERQDIPVPVRGLLWLVEALLSLRGGHVAAASPREAELAGRLPGRQAVVYVPNVVRSMPAAPRPLPDDGGRPLHLATLGRISPQKGPDFFCRAARLSRAAALPLRWTWIGGGEPSDEQALREAGVQVTGWSPRPEALAWLASADVYVHTAAWESSPLSILEAAALGLPILARRNAALEALGIQLLCDSPEVLVAEARSLTDERRRQGLATGSRELLERHRPASQCRALESVYSRAARVPQARRTASVSA